MAGEKSLYRKLQLVLEQAAASDTNKLGDLAAQIESKRLPNFNTFQYDEKKDSFFWRQSPKVIRRTVRLSARLGLVDANGLLTKDGRLALRKTQFNNVIADKVRDALAKDGIAVGKLNDIIKESLNADPPLLPTAKALWATLKAEVGAGEFSRFLTLLSHCGAAQSSQAKVYLRLEGKMTSANGKDECPSVSMPRR